MEWTTHQKKLLDMPLESKVLVKGPVGCGKTSLLKKRYLQYVERGVEPARILVLVMNRSQSLLWREEVDDWIPGKVVRTSYFGFVQQQLQKYWPLILAAHPEIEIKALMPTFLTFEVSQFLMDNSIKFHRQHMGFLSTVTASSDRIAIELTGNLARAALAGIPHHQVGIRLRSGSYNVGAADVSIYEEVDVILDDYRKKCLSRGCLDYGLATEVYNEILLKDKDYIDFLQRSYDVVLADNLEEMTASAAELLAVMLPSVKGAFLNFCSDGGYSKFYGANPEYALHRIEPCCTIEELSESHTCPPDFFEFAGHFTRAILQKQVEPYPKAVQVEWEIDATLRSEMIEQIGRRIIKAVGEEKIAPDEIAVVAPFVDPVLECALTSLLEEHEIEVVNTTRRRRAKDNPFINALITLACLAHPHFGILPSLNDIGKTVSLVLGMDPIRSSLVARAVARQKPYMFPRIENAGWRERIGFSNSERYEYIRDWLLEYIQGEPLPIDTFFKRVFLEILISLPKAQENLLACQQVMDSASSFLEGLKPFTDVEDPSREFIASILQGSKSAETLMDVEKALKSKGVLLTTPIHYLSTSKNRGLQIWCDIRSSSWVPRDIKELSNPYVLSASWSTSQEMNAELEERAVMEKISILVKCLLERCRERIVLASSQYSTQGYEEEGALASFWEQVIHPAGRGD